MLPHPVGETLLLSRNLLAHAREYVQATGGGAFALMTCRVPRYSIIWSAFSRVEGAEGDEKSKTVVCKERAETEKIRL